MKIDMEFEQFGHTAHTMTVEPDLKLTALLEASIQDAASRAAVLRYIYGIVSQEDPASSGITEYTIRCIEYFTAALQQAEHVENSALIGIRKLLIVAPISRRCKTFKAVSTFFAKHETHPETQIDLFVKLQTIEVLIRNYDWDNAEILSKRLESAIEQANKPNSFIYRLQQAAIFHNRQDLMQEYDLRLHLIYDCLDDNDPDAALYSLLEWINSLPRQKNPELRMSLLLNLYAKYDSRDDLISISLLYNLFTLEDRLLKPSEKMQIVRKIFQCNVSLLNVQQIQAVYFFAGCYSSGMQSRFNDSILYYQYSNYFIYKSWQYLRDISSYLRVELGPDLFITAHSKMELRTVEFTNQISLQNNAYVETLQAEYTKIDELYKKVEELSLTDTLTGLHNRRYLEDNLPQLAMLSSRHESTISFAMLDIDYFKAINDNYGHLAGDYILKEIGTIIKTHFRKSDIVVRYGGEEFFIALYDMPREHVLSNLESLRERVEKFDFVYRQHRMPLTISAGITSWNFHSKIEVDIQEIITKTDEALYMAKKTGRNKVYVG